MLPFYSNVWRLPRRVLTFVFSSVSLASVCSQTFNLICTWCRLPLCDVIDKNAYRTPQRHFLKTETCVRLVVQEPELPRQRAERRTTFTWTFAYIFLSVWLPVQIYFMRFYQPLFESIENLLCDENIIASLFHKWYIREAVVVGVLHSLWTSWGCQGLLKLDVCFAFLHILQLLLLFIFWVSPHFGLNTGATF